MPHENALAKDAPFELRPYSSTDHLQSNSSVKSAHPHRSVVKEARKEIHPDTNRTNPLAFSRNSDGRMQSGLALTARQKPRDDGETARATAGARLCAEESGGRACVRECMDPGLITPGEP